MRNLYLNLAVNSLRKNRNFYLPYIASSVVMFAMFYILEAIITDPVIASVRGARTLGIILKIGVPVIGFLSVLFIFYMSSFIMKRRKKELGIYSVLGMEKRHVIRVVFYENLIVTMLTLAFGTFFGVVLEKVAQLGLLKVLHQPSSMSFNIYFEELSVSLCLFGGIFVLVLLNSIREIIFKATLEYIKEEQAGEKKPKIHWVGGAIGLILLGIAYYLASSLDGQPTSAIEVFFVAVILVIIATYLIFITGSIVVLELMKRNKRYYYKTNNFVSVSGMTYRMKRNGAGLASICILSTMVLVMLSSVSTLYFYKNKTFAERFQYDFSVTASMRDAEDADEIVDEYSDESIEDTVEAPRFDSEEYGVEELTGEIEVCAQEAGVRVSNLVCYKSFTDLCRIEDSVISSINEFTSFYELWVMTISDYNMLNHTNVTLGDNQIGWYVLNSDLKFDNLTWGLIGEFEGVKLDKEPKMMVGEYTTVSNGIVFLVINDSMTLEDCAEKIHEENPQNYINTDDVVVSFDIEGDEDDEKKFFDTYNEMYLEPVPADFEGEFNSQHGEYKGVYRSIFSSTLFREVFYNMYGGLFFIGIILSICCIVVAVLIMYFKQLLEGYEDAKRFIIMKKVGLTSEEIKKSVYSQIVMIFIVPLIFAGIHTAFAYKLICILISIFGLNIVNGYFVVLMICLAIFMIFYGLVFWITSQRYFKIVNAADNAI